MRTHFLLHLVEEVWLDIGEDRSKSYALKLAFFLVPSDHFYFCPPGKKIYFEIRILRPNEADLEEGRMGYLWAQSDERETLLSFERERGLGGFR